MNKYNNRMMIFIVEAVAMILEICMSYISSPFFGNSNTVWTGIIAVILLSNSIGNYIGGVITKDGKRVHNMLNLIVIAILVINIVSEFVCVITSSLFSIKIAPIIASLVLLLPTEVMLGTIPPQIMNLESINKQNQKITGVIYSLSTLGGLLGTLVGGFILIPRFGVNMIVVLCAILIMLINVLSIKQWFDIKRLIMIVVIICLFVVNIFVIRNGIFHIQTLSSNILEVKDSEYNRIVISKGEYDDEPVIEMSMNAGFESACYSFDDKHYDLVFNYFKRLDNVISETNMVKDDILMLGGAAYQFPKHVLKEYHNSNIDVVELDPEVTKLAYKYFYLQDCIDTYDADNTRFNNYNEDAKLYILDCDKKYDIIINDVFSGITPVRTLTTVETIHQIKDCMTNDGFYMINIIGSVDGKNSKFLKSEIKTLKQVFANVIVVPARNLDDKTAVDNFCVIATDKNITIPGRIDIDDSEGIILTDNYCPIDSMLVEQ